MTDYYTKFAKVRPISKTSTTTVACIFFESWVASYCIPSIIITDKGPPFVSKFFVAVCNTLVWKTITTTAYHPQTNGQAKRLNSTVISQMCHYVSEYQTDWNKYLLSFTHAYIVQVQRPIKVSSFGLALRRVPSGPASFLSKCAKLASDESMASPMYVGLELIRSATHLRQKADKNLKMGQGCYKKNYDRRLRLAPIFASATTVFCTGCLSSARLQNHPPRKGIIKDYSGSKDIIR